MNYNKIWSLFNSENLSKRGMARITGMSPSGFESMMERKTMTVETLEVIAQYFKKDMSYFFDTDTDTLVSSNPSEQKTDAPDLPGFIKMPHHGNANDPEIKTYSCQDCIKKQKEIDRLTETIKLKDEIIDAKEDALIAFRGKRENLSETGT